ncbi:AGAP007065-PA-like protein [Anopheles sinensis]|uniref:AGAP007065-PA-like protein n=1 Tax=Anopheles sinensis TaxID=74873 RepID=A0A084WJQ4_ANOSI|nr:AGAP007065-PA-like protein [Anopheles sinensis]
MDYSRRGVTCMHSPILTSAEDCGEAAAAAQRRSLLSAVAEPKGLNLKWYDSFVRCTDSRPSSLIVVARERESGNGRVSLVLVGLWHHQPWRYLASLEMCETYGFGGDTMDKDYVRKRLKCFNGSSNAASNNEVGGGGSNLITNNTCNSTTNNTELGSMRWADDLDLDLTNELSSNGYIRYDFNNG